MRELKFRVWNNRTKSFLSEEHLHQYEICISCTGQYIIQNILYGKEKIGKDIIIQQYIGLKDKNYKECYEGDLISFRPKSDKPPFYQVKYDSERACFLPYHIKHKCFLEDDEYFPMFLYSDEFRILGNILENPELIQ